MRKTQITMWLKVLVIVLVTVIKIISGEVTLYESDHNDMKAVFQQIFPECGDKMSSFLLSQKQALEREPNGRRWNADIIRLCLTMWCRKKPTWLF